MSGEQEKKNDCDKERNSRSGNGLLAREGPDDEDDDCRPVGPPSRNISSSADLLSSDKSKSDSASARASTKNMSTEGSSSFIASKSSSKSSLKSSSKSSSSKSSPKSLSKSSSKSSSKSLSKSKRAVQKKNSPTSNTDNTKQHAKDNPSRNTSSRRVGSIEKTRTTTRSNNVANNNNNNNNDNDEASQAEYSLASTAPAPPSLRVRDHYAMKPGAYRMSSGGVAHFVDDEEDNFTVESSSVPPPPTLNYGVSLGVSIDASLVEDLPLSSIPPIPNIIDGYNLNHVTNNDDESGRHSRGYDTSSNDQYNGRGYGDECRSSAQSMECGISMTQTASTAMMSTTNITSREEENPSFDKDSNNDRRYFNKRNITWGICILVLFLIAVVSMGTLYAITGFGRKKNINGMNTDSQNVQNDKFPPPLVVAPPSITPIDVSSPSSSLPPINRPLEDLEEALPEYTKESLQLEDSPQSKAMNWMLKYDDIKYYTLPRKLQRFALITLYFSITTVDPSNEILTWLAGLDECRWYDSTCVDNVYTMLSVQSNYTLRGTIVPELALLSSLEYLRLDQNALVGVFPTMLGRMTTLKEIHLNDNLFRGTIPSQFGNLTNLVKIDFGNNILSGVIPNFQKLGNLQSLRLGSNKFSGTLPSYVGQLTSLNELNVSDNRFTGTVPTEVGYLTSLTSLDLKSNAFEETIPSELGLLTNAASFWFHDNDFTGNVPNDICDLTYTYNTLERRNIIVDCDYVVCSCCTCVPKENNF